MSIADTQDCLDLKHLDDLIKKRDEINQEIEYFQNALQINKGE